MTTRRTFVAGSLAAAAALALPISARARIQIGQDQDQGFDRAPRQGMGHRAGAP